MYYIQTDMLGSWEKVVNASKGVVQSCHFDPWGNRMTTNNWAAQHPDSVFQFRRGFTGHEHYDRFGIINMNARLYDPAIGRFFSPDPQVQNPFLTQGYNRYSYCGNNPVMYTDPDGEFVWWIPAVIGATIGMYAGGVMANNGEYRPWRWNYRSGTTWGYMAGGAVGGFLSGWAGGAIASSQIPMANTASIMFSSSINSIGTSLYTGGRTPVSVSFGFASYDFTNNSWEHLFKVGNTWYENLGYGLGAMANASDFLMGTNPQDVDLITEHEGHGHSAIVESNSATGNGLNDPNGIISVGLNYHAIGAKNNWHWTKGQNHWYTYTADEYPIWRYTLNVNKETILRYGDWLNSLENTGRLIYSVELSSCVTHASVALNLSGVFNIGIHPYLLSSQMYLWSNGVRPWSYSYLLNL